MPNFNLIAIAQHVAQKQTYKAYVKYVIIFFLFGGCKAVVFESTSLVGSSESVNGIAVFSCSDSLSAALSFFVDFVLLSP